MKTIRIIFLVFILMACTKENDDYRSVGIITGRDYTFNACTAGWIIYIKGVKYLFDSIPENSNFILDIATLPMSVRLDWQMINNGCPIKRITIKRIEKLY